MAGPNWAELGADDILLQLRLNPGASSGFVDTHQWSQLRRSECHINGGHANAQLRRVALQPEPDVACWRVDRAHVPTELANSRQLRAYVYRHGVEDGALGDILVGDHIALATAPDVDMANLLPGAELTATWDEPAVTLERATVSALRLDAAVASLFRVSRGEGQTAIEYGFIFQNFEPVKKRTATIAQGDQLVFRTKGRVEIVECDATTKSGRIAVSFKRFTI